MGHRAVLWNRALEVANALARPNRNTPAPSLGIITRGYMAGKSLQAYALARAAAILGGAAALATRLSISQTRLKLYLDDLERLPQAVFLKIVDVLSDDEIANLAKEHLVRANSEEARPKKNGNKNGNGNGNNKKP